jgi:PAS domain S-box-containing protein
VSDDLASPSIAPLTGLAQADLLRWGVAAGSLVGVAVGAAVLAAWYAGIPLLTRIGADFVAMQFNTAAGLLLAGLSLYGIARGRRTLAVACAATLLLLGGLTLVEHLARVALGLDDVLWRLGVDRLAMQSTANVPESAAGRMAPNTALALVLLAASLLALGAPRMTRARLLLATIGSLVAATLGLIAFFGYLIGIPTAYGWGQLSRMAVHTAAAMVALGLGTFAAAVLAARRTGLSVRRWMPVLAGAVVAGASLMRWQALVDHDRRSLEATVRRQSVAMAGELARRVGDRGLLLSRLAGRWAHEGVPDPSAWALAADQVVHDYPGLTDIEWADAESVRRWRSPDDADHPPGARLSDDPDVAAALRAAAIRGTTQATGPLRARGGPRTLLVAPVVRGGAVVGYLTSELAFAPLAAHVLGEQMTAGYAFTLSDGPVLLYQRRRAQAADLLRWQASAPVEALGRRWTIAVVPTNELVAASSSAMPALFFISGLLFAGAIAWIVHVAQRSGEQSERLAALVHRLALENEARREAEVRRDEHAKELSEQAEELARQNEFLQHGARVLGDQRRALVQAQEFRAALVRSTPDAVAAFDSAGCVNDWNPAMAALTGRAYAEVVGQAVGDLLHFVPRGEEVRLVLDALEGRTSKLVDVPARDAQTDAEVWLDVTISPMRTTDGRTLGGLLVARDVTERKRVADVILASKNAAEEANRAKSDFLARMSHELRTPLNSVIGFTNVLRRNRDGRLNADEVTYLERINANGRHLLTLINEVLDLAKIEAGRETVQLEPTAVGALVREVVADLDVRASGASVRLVADVPDETLVAVTDAAKLKQVLINLVGNAIKFTPATGRVTVRVASDAAHGSATRVEVEDTGIGIAEDRLVAIFDAFEQADEQTSRRYGGTGLGLAISRKLCTLMGHDLIVHSEVGRGSVFMVLLHPRAAGEAAA